MRRRFEAIQSSLLATNGSSVSVFVPIVKYSGETGRCHPEAMSALGLKLVDANMIDYEEDEGVTFDLYGGAKETDSVEIELLLTGIMQDEIMQSVMIAQNGNIIAPYEGGFDIFSDRVDEIDGLRRLYPTWMSDRSDGL